MTRLFPRVEHCASLIAKAVHGSSSKFVAADDGSAVIYDAKNCTAYFVSLRQGIQRTYEGNKDAAVAAMRNSDSALASVGLCGARWIGGV